MFAKKHPAGWMSPRMAQTLLGILAGRSESDIAKGLGIAHNTVHHYVKSLYRRFGASRREALVAALGNAWLSRN